MAKYNIIPSSRTIVQSPISIGHKAEKGVEAIEFDLTAWVETYGSGTLTVIMRRWGDAIPYPITLEIDENNKATWTLSDTDTAKAGMAYAQLNYIVGDEVVKKSDIYTFRVMDSLTGEGDPPEAYESWLESLTHLAAEAMAEVLDIEGIVTDKTLTVDGGIADAKATGDALSALEDAVTEETDKIKADLDAIVPGLSQEAKAALLACFDHVYWDGDNGDTYYQALRNVLYASGLVSITAVFSPGTAKIYSDDNLNTLKAYLTVTGLYENGQSKVITDYALSGSLSVGTNTITVSRDGKITTFSVTVANALDRIAFETLTYRDIFITGNYFTLGGFENIDVIPSTETTLPNGDSYYGYYGDPIPSITTDVVNKGSHALKWASTGSSQILYTSSRLPKSGHVLIAGRQYVTRYVSGRCGVQFNIKTDESHKTPAYATLNFNTSEDFVTVIRMEHYDVSGGQGDTRADIFCGSFQNGNSDGYIDDVVIAIVPDEMTLETATTLYNNYISMI